jgi:AraC-like DNA-binding protein
MPSLPKSWQPPFTLRWCSLAAERKRHFRFTPPYCGIMIPLSGRCVVHTKGVRHLLQRGMVYLSFPGEQERIGHAEGFRFFNLFFEEPDPLRHPFISVGGSREKPVLFLKSTELVEQTAEELARQKDFTTDVSQRLFLATIFNIMHFVGVPEQEKPPSSRAEALMRNVELLYEQDPPAVTVSSLASRLKVSAQTLFLASRSVFGKPTQSFLADLRLQHVERLLRETDFKIAYIAAVVGYRNEKYLMRCFKRAYGVTPTAYRKRHWEKMSQASSTPASERPSRTMKKRRVRQPVRAIASRRVSSVRRRRKRRGFIGLEMLVALAMCVGLSLLVPEPLSRGEKEPLQQSGCPNSLEALRAAGSSATTASTDRPSADL